MRTDEYEFLSPEDREVALALAREALLRAARGQPVPAARAFSQQELGSVFDTELPVFVTLRVLGQLRGCIGSTSAVSSLADAIAWRTTQSATQDRRFAPIGPHEVQDTTISIAILSPVAAVGHKDEIEIGRHGVTFEYDGCRSVLLPSVMVERGWDVDQTLEVLALKAGIDDERWKTSPGPRLGVFEVQSFGEG